VTRDPGYLIGVERSELDLARFEDLVGEAGRVPPERAAALLHDALAVWRGPPLADLADEPFARAAVPRLEDVRIAALGAGRGCCWRATAPVTATPLARRSSAPSPRTRRSACRATPSARAAPDPQPGRTRSQSSLNAMLS
jgi:transcriptional activator